MEKGNGCCFFTTTLNATILLVVSITTFVLIRALYVMYQSGKPLRKTALQSVSTLIVLGSGGHTAEMLNLISMLQKDKFTPRFYIAAATDNMSLQKAHLMEKSLVDMTRGNVLESVQFMQIYRSREVGQSYITSVGTTLIAIAHALWIMIKIRPQVVVGIRWSSTIYVESIARVRRLFLSGLLLYKLRMVDQFFVQWPQLQKKYP